MSKVQCLICGKEFGKITASHLKTHNMTRAEYREKYGQEGLSNFANCFRKAKIPLEPIDRYSIRKYYNCLNARFDENKIIYGQMKMK